MLAIFVAASRLLPHWPNFTPVGAFALFVGVYMRDRRWAFALPLAVLFLSDLILGLHPLIPVVYASYAVNVLLGQFIRNWVNPLSVSLAVLLGSLQFFVLTNLASWLMVGHTTQGLVENFLLAIPFHRNSLAGDIFYSAMFFGAAALIRIYLANKARQEAIPS
jgi:hypothetical protein